MIKAKRNSDCTGFTILFNLDDGTETEMEFGPDEWSELLNPVHHVNSVQRLLNKRVSSVVITAVYN